MSAIGKPDSTHAAGSLELQVAARDAFAVLTLRNVGPNTVTVFSCVQANLEQYDWFTVFLESNGETRTLHLYDDRNVSSRVTAELAPGEQIEHVIDIVAWAMRKANGVQSLGPGNYRMWATYEVSDSGPVWNGKLRSATVAITIK